MRKLVLMVILGLILALSAPGFGGGKSPVARAALPDNLTFNSLAGGYFRRSNQDIKHYISSSSGVYMATYSLIPQASKHGITYSPFLNGTIRVYRLKSIQSQDGNNFASIQSASSYRLLIFDMVNTGIKNIAQAQKYSEQELAAINQNIPFVIGLGEHKSDASWTEKSRNHLAVLGTSLDVGVIDLLNLLNGLSIFNDNSKYDTYIKVEGTNNSPLGRYIAATSDYTHAQFIAKNFSVLNIQEPRLSGDIQSQLEQAYKQCQNKFLKFEAKQGNQLPQDIKNHLKILDPNNVIFKDYINQPLPAGHQYQDWYESYYSSGRDYSGYQISDRHILSNTPQMVIAQDLKNQFDTDFLAWRDKYKAEVTDIPAGATAFLLATIWSKKPLLGLGAAAGVEYMITQARTDLIELLSQYKNILFHQALISYYVQKHIEYHQCVSQAAPDLPSDHPFSKQNLIEEQRNAQMIASDVSEGAAKVNADEANDCKFDFFKGTAGGTINGLICQMVKLTVGAMSGLSDLAYRFFLNNFINAGTTIEGGSGAAADSAVENGSSGASAPNETTPETSPGD